MDNVYQGTHNLWGCGYRKNTSQPFCYKESGLSPFSCSVGTYMSGDEYVIDSGESQFIKKMFIMGLTDLFG